MSGSIQQRNLRRDDRYTITCSKHEDGIERLVDLPTGTKKVLITKGTEVSIIHAHPYIRVEAVDGAYKGAKFAVATENLAEIPATAKMSTEQVTAAA